MTLGENPCARGVETVADFRQAQDFDRSGAIGKPADETSLLKRHDQAMNSGFRAQIQRLFHFVEGRRHSCLLEALMDETQELTLLFCQHHRPPAGPFRFAVNVRFPRTIATWRKQITNKA